LIAIDAPFRPAAQLIDSKFVAWEDKTPPAQTARRSSNVLSARSTDPHCCTDLDPKDTTHITDWTGQTGTMQAQPSTNEPPGPVGDATPRPSTSPFPPPHQPAVVVVDDDDEEEDDPTLSANNPTVEIQGSIAADSAETDSALGAVS